MQVSQSQELLTVYSVDREVNKLIRTQVSVLVAKRRMCRCEE